MRAPAAPTLASTVGSEPQARRIWAHWLLQETQVWTPACWRPPRAAAGAVTARPRWPRRDRRSRARRLEHPRIPDGLSWTGPLRASTPDRRFRARGSAPSADTTAGPVRADL